MGVRARTAEFNCGWFTGGVTLALYQFSVGASIRYWPCVKAPVVKLYFGPFKLWLAMIPRGRQ